MGGERGRRWGRGAPFPGPLGLPTGGRWEGFTLEPVEGAFGLDGTAALAPGDGRVIPLEVADCPSIELAICQENIPMGIASPNVGLH